MDLLDVLEIDPERLPYNTAEAVADSETQFRAAGRPSAPGPLQEFLDSQLRRCEECGLRYPRVFLLRLKQLQRREWAPGSRDDHWTEERAAFRGRSQRTEYSQPARRRASSGGPRLVRDLVGEIALETMERFGREIHENRQGHRKRP